MTMSRSVLFGAAWLLGMGVLISSRGGWCSPPVPAISGRRWSAYAIAGWWVRRAD